MNLFDLDKHHFMVIMANEMRPNILIDKRPKWNEWNRTQSYVFYKQDNIRPRVNTVRLLGSLDRYSEACRM